MPGLDFDAEDLGVPDAVPEPVRVVQPVYDRPVAESPLKRRHYEMRQLAQHSSASVEHYTPEDIIARARYVLGSIDVDPASSWLVQRRIQATQWYGIQENMCTRTDGLRAQWPGRVWLNPPGGKTEKHAPHLCSISKSYACVWWAKLIDEYRSGRTTAALYLGFSLEQLAVSQRLDGVTPILVYPTIILRDRLCFDYPRDTSDGNPRAQTEIVKGSQPTHGNFITGIGVDMARFREAFGGLGVLVVAG